MENQIICNTVTSTRLNKSRAQSQVTWQLVLLCHKRQDYKLIKTIEMNEPSNFQ